MSRVIKNGRKTEHRITCEECGSIIGYKAKDIVEEHIPKEQTTLKMYEFLRKYIMCPLCQHEINLITEV